MARLAGRLGLGILAQTVSGLAFGLSGYLVARLGFLSINAAVAWLPWVLLWLTPTDGRSCMARKDIPKLSLCLALLLLAGHAQTAWYILLLAGLWAGFWALKPGAAADGGFDSRPASSALKRLASAWLWLGLAAMLALGLSAAQLLPTAEYLTQSQRASLVEYDFAMNYSFWPWHLSTLLAPGLFGSPVSGDYWGYANYWEDAIYVGLLPLILAVAALVRGLPHRTGRRTPMTALTWFLAVLFAVALLFSLGKFTPVFPWLYRNIPTFNMFQAPARWMLWAEFSLALLAGIGAQGWRRPQGWGLYWARLATMGAFAISVGAGLAWYSLGEISPSFIRAAAVLGVLGVGVGVLGLLAPPDETKAVEGFQTPSDGLPVGPENPSSSRQGAHKRLFQFAPPATAAHAPYTPRQLAGWQWAVSAFVAFDLILAGLGLNPAGPLELYSPAPTAESVRQLAQGGRLYLPESQETWLKYTRFLRFDTFDPGESWVNLRAVLLPNTNMLDALPSVNNFDPLLPGRYADWLEMLESASPAQYKQLLQLMDVGAVETLSRSEPFGVRFQAFDGQRVRLAACGRRAASPDEAREWVLEEGTDFDRQVILEELAALPDDDCQPPAAADTLLDQREVMLDEDGPNRLELVIPAGPPAWLVLSDVWYPGWRAWVDDQPAELLRANYLFRAVRLPAGEHRVKLVYQPFSFFVGLLLCALTLVVLVFAWLRMKRLPPVLAPRSPDSQEAGNV
jgi:hypothetical protein